MIKIKRTTQAIMITGHASTNGAAHTIEHVKCCNAITGMAYMLCNALMSIGAPEDKCKLSKGYMIADISEIKGRSNKEQARFLLDVFILSADGVREQFPDMIEIINN